MKYVGHMGEMRNASRIFTGKPEGKRSCARCRLIGRVILKWILKKECMRVLIGFI
jgi:hypothetical protein